jgi:hypothetical protein
MGKQIDTGHRRMPPVLPAHHQQRNVRATHFEAPSRSLSGKKPARQEWRPARLAGIV